MQFGAKFLVRLSFYFAPFTKARHFDVTLFEVFTKFLMAQNSKL